MIAAIVVSHIIRLICLKKLFNEFSYKDYLVVFLFPALLITLAVSIVLFKVTIWMDLGLIRLVVSVIICIVLVCSLCVLFGLTKKEKEYILSLLRDKRHR